MNQYSPVGEGSVAMVGTARMEYVSASRDGLDRTAHRIKMNVQPVHVKMGVLVITYLDPTPANAQMDTLDNTARLDPITVHPVHVKMVASARMNWMAFSASVRMNSGEISASMCLKASLNCLTWSLIQLIRT